MTKGSPSLACRRDVLAKAPLLDVTRAVVVVIVEAGFADRHHLGMTRAGDEIGGRDVRLLMRAVGMGADRAIDLGKAFGDRQHLAVALHPRGNGDKAPDARRARARHDCVELVREVGKIEVAMAVDEHGGYVGALVSGST